MSNPTNTEKLISHGRRRQGILVPLIEDFLLNPVRVESHSDIAWVKDVMARTLAREQVRAQNRRYSPSSLSECVRKVFLAKNYEELGITKISELRPDMSYYFLTGEWNHLKWQFVLHKMAQANMLKLYGVEIPVISKHGDYGGTIDAVVGIDNVGYTIDFKGLNVRSFNADPELKYELQLASYTMLANVDRSHKFPPMDSGLLVFENKGGPDAKHPVALREILIPLEKHQQQILTRREVLRHHERKGIVPEPECTSTKGFQFKSCPFRQFCRKEIKAIEQHVNRSDSSEFKVRVSTP